MFNDITIYFFQIFQDLLRIPNTFQSDLITAVIALFVVIDPIGNIPLFIALTKKVRKRGAQNCIQNCYTYCRNIISYIWCSRITD
ncbi:MAG TPA: MarC family protein, partial [Nitrososphaeraceae archaeon]|nr:MarC family protein [Nitrososphaeraceae archaeon]